MTNKILGSAIFWLLFVTTTVVAESSQQPFLDAASRIPTALIRLGFRNFGRLDLESLMAKIEGGNVIFHMDGNVGKRNGDGRASGRWEVVDGVRHVYLDPYMWSKFSDQQSVLALHECLGPFGFEDSYYWISTSMWFLTLPLARSSLSASELHNLEAWMAEEANNQLPKGTRVAGGVVGVGGGGESASIWARMRRLNGYLVDLQKHQTPEQRAETLNDISIALSSELTVSWPVPN